MSTERPKMLPCRKCGSAPVVETVRLSKLWTMWLAHCPKCGPGLYTARTYYFEEIHARNAWNLKGGTAL